MSVTQSHSDVRPSAYPQVKTIGVRSGVGGAGEDAISQVDGHIYVPKNTEVYSYDDDGNLTSDGRWIYADLVRASSIRARNDSIPKHCIGAERRRSTGLRV
jgi:hypothetical protein